MMKTRIPIAAARRSLFAMSLVRLWSTMGREMKIERPIMVERRRVSAKLAMVPAITHVIFNMNDVN